MFDEIKQKILKKLDSFIALKPRTTFEVSERVRKHLQRYTDEELSPEDKKTISLEIVELLQNQKILDDKQYAHDYAQFVHLSSKSLSPMQMRFFLRKKRLPDDLIAEVLLGLDASKILESAVNLAKKKVRTYAKYGEDKQRWMLYGYLAQKGYSAEIIRSAVDIAAGVK